MAVTVPHSGTVTYISPHVGCCAIFLRIPAFLFYFSPRWDRLGFHWAPFEDLGEHRRRAWPLPTWAPLTVLRPTPALWPLTIAWLSCTPALPSSVVIENAKLMMLDCCRRIAMLKAFHFPAVLRGCLFEVWVFPNFLYILYHKKDHFVKSKCILQWLQALRFWGHLGFYARENPMRLKMPILRSSMNSST